VTGALALFDRIYEYLDLVQEIVDSPDAVAINRRTSRAAYPTTRSRSGTKKTGKTDSRRHLVRDRARTTGRRVGHSGAGKTTLTYLIPRLYDPDTGTVSIDEIDIRKSSSNPSARSSPW